MAWRTEFRTILTISICGCSVDQVHQDMRYRFDQAAMLAEIASATPPHMPRRRNGGASESRCSIRRSPATRSSAARPRLLIRARTNVAETADGRRVPVALDAAREQRHARYRMPAAEFKSIIGWLERSRRCSPHGESLRDRDCALRSPAGEPLHEPCGVQRFWTSKNSGLRFARGFPIGHVRIHAHQRRAMLCQLRRRRSRADGIQLLSAGARRGRRLVEASPASVESIENEFFRLTPMLRGLDIRDLARNAAMELYFEDDGDRGDEYNFDPVGDGAAIATRSISRASSKRPVRKRIRLSMTFEVPAALAADTRARLSARERLEVALTATLYAGLDRVDFAAEVNNRARDHRLRAALRTPVVATDSVHDTSFGVLRPRSRPRNRGGPRTYYPTVPQRTFTAVEGAEFSAALASRGILEVEARPEPAGATTILLTLLRCVGWLSRSDLATRRGGAGPELETPGAQELGEHRFEFAVATFRGSYLEGRFAATGRGLPSPPRVFAGRRDDRGAGAVAGLQQFSGNLFHCATVGPREFLQGARIQRVADARDCSIHLLRQWARAPRRSGRKRPEARRTQALARRRNRARAQAVRARDVRSAGSAAVTAEDFFEFDRQKD